MFKVQSIYSASGVWTNETIMPISLKEASEYYDELRKEHPDTRFRVIRYKFDVVLDTGDQNQESEEE